MGFASTPEGRRKHHMPTESVGVKDYHASPVLLFPVLKTGQRGGHRELDITYKRPEAKAEGRENANSLTNRMLAALKMYKLLHKPMHPWRIMVHSL